MLKREENGMKIRWREVKSIFFLLVQPVKGTIIRTEI